MTFEGGCYCGAVRYRAEGQPQLEAQCHCRECQYITGGGPNMLMSWSVTRAGLHQASFADAAAKRHENSHVLNF
jgi:hypothetical protein